MSNFICTKCGKAIIDSERGCITGCEHYPLTTRKNVPKEKLRRFEAALRLFETLKNKVKCPHCGKIFEYSK